MTTLTPFASNAASVSIGKLTIKNGTDRLAIYGSLDITRDRPGLAQARALQAILVPGRQRLNLQFKAVTVSLRYVNRLT